jgi:putative membrane protein
MKGLMKNTKNLKLIAGSLALAGLLAAGRAGAADASVTAGTSADKSASSSTSSKASSFIKEAAQGNQSEIALAQLAQQKAQNAEIKQLAQMLQNDHQQAQQKLQAIAQAHNVTLDETPGWSQKRAQSKLEKLSGTEFDQQYAKDMLEDHVNDLKMYQKAADSIQETDVKEFAQNTISTLRTHLQHAETAAKAAGVDQATITSITKKAPESVGGTSEKSESESGAGKNSQQP